jgi:hypothetical protein
VECSESRIVLIPDRFSKLVIAFAIELGGFTEPHA